MLRTGFIEDVETNTPGVNQHRRRGCTTCTDTFDKFPNTLTDGGEKTGDILTQVFYLITTNL